MIPARIVVETFPNPQCRDFHTTVRLSNHPIHYFQGSIRDSSKKYLEDVGPVGTELVRNLFEIPGIGGVFIHPYHVGPRIGEAFRWAEDGIADAVIEVIKEAFGDRKGEVEVSWKPDVQVAQNTPTGDLVDRDELGLCSEDLDASGLLPD